MLSGERFFFKGDGPQAPLNTVELLTLTAPTVFAVPKCTDWPIAAGKIDVRFLADCVAKHSLRLSMARDSVD